MKYLLMVLITPSEDGKQRSESDDDDQRLRPGGQTTQMGMQAWLNELREDWFEGS
jgi:hypothetical protein